ncbi:SPOSA6832_01340, partial [Sporobolomyces salmonicolor]
MVIKLYDLVPRPGGPSFSPACLRARLALMHKRLPFGVTPVTYHDLRFHWKDKLGVEKATAPFIQKEDGSYLMDSVKIALWLDTTYPDRPSIFLPEAPVPVDVNSAEYKEAVTDFEKMLISQVCLYSGQLWSHPLSCAGTLPPTGPAKDESGKLAPPFYREVFKLYARRVVKSFDKETYEYWTCDDRLGPGVWASIQDNNEDATIKSVQSTLKQLSEENLSDSVHFFSSPSTPGMKVRPSPLSFHVPRRPAHPGLLGRWQDFALMGVYGLLRSTSPKLAKETFESLEAGRTGEWLARMNRALPTPEVWERDPKE